MARPGIEPRSSDLRVRCPTTVLRGPAKVRRNTRYDVDVKTYLHDVNYVIYRNGSTVFTENGPYIYI